MRSLYGKFLLFTLLTMVGSALIAFLAVNTLYHQLLKGENDAKNMAILQEITSYIERHPNIDLEDFLQTQADVGYKLVLSYHSGSQLITERYGDAFREENLANEVIQDVIDGKAYHGMRDLPKETFVTGFFADELANSVGTSFTLQGQTYALFLRPNIKLLFTEVHFLLGGLLLGMGLLSLLAMLFVAHRLITPLRQLTIATKDIGKGDYKVHFPKKSRDEVGELAQSFETMAKELERAEKRQKRFITDVSHDLQTPLQQMKGYAKLLQEEKVTEKEQAYYLSIIERESDRLSSLSRQLLTLTSLDISQDTLDKQPFRLDKQLKAIIERFRWQIEEREQTIIAKVPEVSILAHEGFLEQLWENLLSNAIKYSPDGSSLFLQLQEKEDQVEFILKDEGEGIDSEALPFIFDRFYRADRSRQQKIKGTGLGLAIAKQIVDLHNGKIDLRSDVGKGTTVKVILPK